MERRAGGSGIPLPPALRFTRPDSAFSPVGDRTVEERAAGYFIYPEFWNRGYTTEAFERVLQFAFLENNVYRVSTGCLSENIGSEKVMQKCGLIKEAEHIDYEWHDGKMKTRLEYRLLKKEWEAHNSSHPSHNFLLH